MALLFGWRFRAVLYGAVLALLGVFTGLILYGWMFKNLKDCGCFGPIEISPGMSILKNAVLALMCMAAWLFWGKREKGEKGKGGETLASSAFSFSP